MIPTPAWLAKRKAAITADLYLKIEAGDWHGVQDCASDIREIQAQLAIIGDVMVCDHLWRYDIQTDGYLCEKCQKRTMTAPV